MQRNKYRGIKKDQPVCSMAGAFTLIELMLAIAIMGVIIFALYHVFNQTQRAMRSNEIQGDISEKARAIMDMISREIEQSQPTFSTTYVPVRGRREMETNFFGGLELPPRVQKADRADIQSRTNMLYNLFFTSSRTNAWTGIGYRVTNVVNGVGVLVRYETILPLGQRPYANLLSSNFVSSDPLKPLLATNYHHVADGVIHFKVVPYDLNGYRLGFDTTNKVPGVYDIVRMSAGGTVNKNTNYTDPFFANNVNLAGNLANVVLQESLPTLPEETSYSFKSNALPAYVDLELGMLEPETLKQYNQMLQDQNPNAANFLSRQINKVHLFRERIPIRTAAQ
jgi:prepilin-type N-terminal cleavage/methylation domain-containing protein